MKKKKKRATQLKTKDGGHKKCLYGKHYTARTKQRHVPNVVGLFCEETLHVCNHILSESEYTVVQSDFYLLVTYCCTF